MLVNRKRLVKTLYAKVRENRITGNAMLDAGGGFPQVCHSEIVFGQFRSGHEHL